MLFIIFLCLVDIPKDRRAGQSPDAVTDAVARKESQITHQSRITSVHRFGRGTRPGIGSARRPAHTHTHTLLSVPRHTGEGIVFSSL